MNDVYSNDGERRSWRQMLLSCSGTAVDRQNQYRCAAWMFAWAVSFVGITTVLLSDHGLSQQVAWMLAAAPNVFAVFALLGFLRFLRMADELMRRIQLEGLAIGFGCSVIFAMGYSLFEHAGAPAVDSNDLLIVMMLGWVGGQLYSMGRYR